MLELEFPELVELNNFGGDFPSYLEYVYSLFAADFIHSKPKFMGRVVSAQKFPLVDGVLHRTFYHITHEGETEDERNPDIRRMERIRFPKFIIEKSPHEELMIWKNTRKRDTRVLIFNEAEQYLCVLTKRRDYYLFWTAYLVEQEHRKRKLRKEYEAYKKTKTA